MKGIKIVIRTIVRAIIEQQENRQLCPARLKQLKLINEECDKK